MLPTLRTPENLSGDVKRGASSLEIRPADPLDFTFCHWQEYDTRLSTRRTCHMFKKRPLQLLDGSDRATDAACKVVVWPGVLGLLFRYFNQATVPWASILFATGLLDSK